MSHDDRLPVRRSRFDDARPRQRRSRFDDDYPVAGNRRSARDHRLDPGPPDDGPATGERWSTWDIGQHGLAPHPDWAVAAGDS